METPNGNGKGKGWTRREALKASGLALGALGIGGGMSGCRIGGDSSDPAPGDPTQRNSLIASLPSYVPGTETLEPDEMRITFLGTTCVPSLSQAAVSAFVELGNGECFMFDAGTGVTPKYFAMKVALDKMSRIFVAHAHSDHIGDLPYIFGFGPSYGRIWPLYVFGPAASSDNPDFVPYEDGDGNVIADSGAALDGISDVCKGLKQFCRWHNESQSFLFSALTDYTTPSWDTVGTDVDGATAKDAYHLVAKDLPWWKTGFNSVTGLPNSDNVAYWDAANDVKITHFPAVHCRTASVSYKLEWNGLSMIYSGDTKPNQYMIDNAKTGVDVLIHEIVMPAAGWVGKMGISGDAAVAQSKTIQKSSHTPQKAFGDVLRRIAEEGRAPALAVGTHFGATDDTIDAALSDIRVNYPSGDLTIASDFMVVNVSKSRGITVRRADVSQFAWPVLTPVDVTECDPPKYWQYETPGNSSTPKVGAAEAQLDPDQLANCVDNTDEWYV